MSVGVTVAVRKSGSARLFLLNLLIGAGLAAMIGILVGIPSLQGEGALPRHCDDRRLGHPALPVLALVKLTGEARGLSMPPARLFRDQPRPAASRSTG